MPKKTYKMRKRIIVILCGIIFFIGSVKAQNSFIEEFNDNNNNWDEINDKKVHEKIKSGKYFFGHKERKGAWASTIKIPVSTTNDFIISSKIEKTLGVNNHGYGLIWGWKDAKNYNTFIISGDRNYKITQTSNGNTSILAGWKMSSHIKKRGGGNILTIRKQGKKLTFTINNKIIERLDFREFSGHLMGFIVNRNIRVKIDYLKVTYDENTSSDNSRIKGYTSFEIKEVRIDDGRISSKTYGNANASIEPGETVDVSISIQNTGNRAETNVNVWCELMGNYNGISSPDIKKKQKTGSIGAGEIRDVKLHFFLSGTFSDKKITVRINIENSKGEITKRYVDLKVGKPDKITKVSGDNQEPSVDLNIPTTKNDGSKTYAVIIGISGYKYAPEATYATNDAETFYKYALNVFQIPKENIYLRTGSDATSGEFSKIFNSGGWLDRRVIANQSKVLVYYAGHGIPDAKTKKSYLLPYDTDPAYASTGFDLQGMYKSLADLKAAEVVVFIDACFSGVNRGNKMLIEGNRAVKIKPANPLSGAGNLNVFTASSSDEYSGMYKQQQHGLFSYYLFRGLQGQATKNGKKLSMSELFDYIRQNVSKKAIALDKEQHPTCNKPKSNKILVNYR